MRAALYARVSTEGQQARGTIGSQLALLHERVAAEGDELVAKFTDDGCSGARLDRPGLDALRDAAEAGLFERVWCLSPDRLARVYAYQVVLDELARLQVKVCFTDAPPITDDPQAILLTQVQGVIAEYERAKITERYRRGKFFRSATVGCLARVNGPLTWRSSSRKPRWSGGSSRTIRCAICRCASSSAGLPPTAFQLRRRATASGVLDHCPALAQRGIRRPGLLQPHHLGPRPAPRTPAPPDPQATGGLDRHHGAHAHQRGDVHRGRPGEQGQQQVEPTPDRARPVDAARPGQMRRLPRRHQLPQDARTQRRLPPYYYCRNHDPIRAGGSDRRCTKRNIRADVLDAFVIAQVRDVLLRPDVLLAGQHASAQKTSSDELLAKELNGLERKIAAAQPSGPGWPTSTRPV